MSPVAPSLSLAFTSTPVATSSLTRAVFPAKAAQKRLSSTLGASAAEATASAKSAARPHAPL